MKIVWKLGDKPVGRYRSFQKRSWPLGTLGKDGKVVAAIYSVNKNGYRPYLASQEELIVHIADYATAVDCTFTWRRLKGTFTGLKAAKQAAEKFLKQNPNWIL